jgi:hypothetical protein
VESLYNPELEELATALCAFLVFHEGKLFAFLAAETLTVVETF